MEFGLVYLRVTGIFVVWSKMDKQGKGLFRGKGFVSLRLLRRLGFRMGFIVASYKYCRKSME